MLQTLGLSKKRGQGRKAMNEMSQAITEIKNKVTLEQWQERIRECKESGKSIRAWCQENGISQGSYYHYLRKIRETVLQEKRLVPLEKPKQEESVGIRITCGAVTVTLSEDVGAEQLKTILTVLKSC